MGFENRKSARVKSGIHLYFWTDGKTSGQGTWAQSLNVSESGMAFLCERFIPPGELILLEFHLPAGTKALRPFAEVVACDREEGKERHHARVKFAGLEGEERLQLRQYVMQQADPKLAALTGWGRAYFGSLPAMEACYREPSPAEQKQWAEERAYISPKEAGYLKVFQAYLEQRLGSRTPESFKLAGSRAFKDHAQLWVELGNPGSQLHLLGKVLWCRQEEGQAAELGVNVTAFHKAEAVRVEKVG